MNAYQAKALIEFAAYVERLQYKYFEENQYTLGPAAARKDARGMTPVQLIEEWCMMREQLGIDN